MKYIISGTNRHGSRTFKISELIQKLYLENGEKVEIIDLAKVPLQDLAGSHYGTELPKEIKDQVTKITSADGLIMVVPEYNGSMPGALKYFIDFWKYPDTFEFRPVCFVGLGGKFGGLRPVEHLQQVFGYRNGYVFPQRVFLQDIFTSFKDDQLPPLLMSLLRDQAVGFQKFVRALESEKLDANSVNRTRVKK
jgi:chromate reductase